VKRSSQEKKGEKRFRASQTGTNVTAPGAAKMTASGTGKPGRANERLPFS
jgi:hypothetical protein